MDTKELSRGVINSLVEEIESIVVEKAYESQQAKLDLFWLTGETLRRYEREQNVPITQLVEACAMDNRLSGKQMGERNLFWALKIFDTFPTKEFPGEKAASLTKVKALLRDGSDNKDAEPDPAKIASEIIKRYGLAVALKIATHIQNANTEKE